MDQSRRYLDHNATTPLDPEVLENIPRWIQDWGNASSIHQEGRGPKFILRESRRILSAHLGTSPLEIIFNSGASEGNNTVIKSFWPPKNGRDHFITSAVEHPSVIKTMQWLESQGAKVDYVPINRDGALDLEFYFSKLSPQTALVSCMLANNETGTIFPIEKMVDAAHKVGAYFHSDCVQAIGKISTNVAHLGIDYATFSGHKIYSLKGTGFLFVKRGVPFESLIHGGAQERSRRGGTENVLGIASSGFMVQKLVVSVVENMKKLTTLRDHFESRLQNELPGVQFNCQNSPRLPNTSSLLIDGIDGETLLMSLDIKGYAVSTGAACSSGNPEPSPVLLALGLTRAEAQSSLRVSFGRFQELTDVDQFVECLIQVVQHLRRINSDSQFTHVPEKTEIEIPVIMAILNNSTIVNSESLNGN